MAHVSPACALWAVPSLTPADPSESPPSGCCEFPHRTFREEVNSLLCPPKRAGRSSHDAPSSATSTLSTSSASEPARGSSLFPAAPGVLCFLFSSGSCSANNNPHSLPSGSCSKVAPSSPGDSFPKCPVTLGDSVYSFSGPHGLPWPLPPPPKSLSSSSRKRKGTVQRLPHCPLQPCRGRW